MTTAMVRTAAQILAEIAASEIPDEDDETWGVAQTARALGVSQVTLREWTRAGWIPSMRGASGRHRYQVADVYAFRDHITASRQPPPVGAGIAAASTGTG